MVALFVLFFNFVFVFCSSTISFKEQEEMILFGVEEKNRAPSYVHDRGFSFYLGFDYLF